jgi:riboflavin synthase
MFTGIIETLAVLESIENQEGNKNLTFQTPLAHELKIDQSVSHNGICLTVVSKQADCYSVTAIQETLLRSNLNSLKIGEKINLERCMVAGARLDGHIVQGHVDTVGTCTKIQLADGSWYFWFSHPKSEDFLTVPKGSIAVNGVSLTVVESWDSGFSVAIIPYTFENTNFRYLAEGSLVNLEFDIIGKYIARQIRNYSTYNTLKTNT